MPKIIRSCGRVDGNAGVTMMQTADPGDWRGVGDASQLVKATAQ